MSRRETAARRIRTGGLALAWGILAALISAGAAGVVTGMEHVPGTAARAELTWRGDQAATPALDAAQGRIESLQPDVDELGVLARGALASLTGQDLDTVQATVDEGAALVAEIRTGASEIRADLVAVPGVTGAHAALATSAAVRERHAAMLEALETTEGLDDAWARLTVGSLAAARLSGLLGDHDQVMGEALAHGVEARYDEAVATIAEAALLLDEAGVMRTQLANTVDVSTLDEWIRRNRRYEDALRELYLAVDESGGTRTDRVREALAEERAARDQLPPDSRGLIVIMAEIGRGGLNGAVITIEQARGQLAAAVEDLVAPTRAP